MYLYSLFFKVLINLSATTKFYSLCLELHFYEFFFNHDFIDLLWRSLPLSTHVLFCLPLDSFKNLWKALVIAILFLSFREITHAYLPKTSITVYREQILLSNLLINWISAESILQILPIKGDGTFLFSKFLIIG